VNPRRSARNSIRLRLGIALATSCLAIVPSHALEKGLSVAIEWSPTEPEKERALWLAYLMSRAKYILKHIDAYPQQVGPVIPSFEEEIEARTTVAKIYQGLRAKDEELDLPYFNDLVRVAQAGFMREYVWHYLRQPAWEQMPANIRMEKFETWRRSNLAEHKPITRGGIRFDQSKE